MSHRYKKISEICDKISLVKKYEKLNNCVFKMKN